MTAFDWGMLGLFVFFSLVTVWSLYSYKASQQLTQKKKRRSKKGKNS
ncbi:hypothetical protein JYB88_18310 [Shewanella cyperi]|uniref:Uncharacterized protein n=1 Tax=Shewanella cyperi TaxID=2814292 RepID=A0A974XRD0_9GAMM|nr:MULTISPECIES: hypothetical protein [Shewanella]MBO2647690.1 hypothetical protein [Shewanella algae]QSX31988.1 hypothetical protein JYB88_18310 [Shewanella cyperi]